jgi:hypothetical protein
MGDTNLTGRLEALTARGGDSYPRLMFFTADDVFQVADDQRGRELFVFSPCRIQVRGKITINRSGEKVIHVRKYTVLQ